MTKKEIENAKEDLKDLRIRYLSVDYSSSLSQTNLKNIDILFQYIDQLEQENNKQNKMIDEMATMLEEAKICYFKKEDGGELLGKYRCYKKEDWKQYFEKKVEEE